MLFPETGQNYRHFRHLLFSVYHYCGHFGDREDKEQKQKKTVIKIKTPIPAEYPLPSRKKEQGGGPAAARCDRVPSGPAPRRDCLRLFPDRNMQTSDEFTEPPAGPPGHPSRPEEQSGSRRANGRPLSFPGSFPVHFPPPLAPPPFRMADLGFSSITIGSLFLRDDCCCCMMYDVSVTMLCAHCIVRVRRTARRLETHSRKL